MAQEPRDTMAQGEHGQPGSSAWKTSRPGHPARVGMEHGLQPTFNTAFNLWGN